MGHKIFTIPDAVSPNETVNIHTDLKTGEVPPTYLYGIDDNGSVWVNTSNAGGEILSTHWTHALGHNPPIEQLVSIMRRIHLKRAELSFGVALVLD